MIEVGVTADRAVTIRFISIIIGRTDNASMNWAYAPAKIVTTPIQLSPDLALAYVI